MRFPRRTAEFVRPYSAIALDRDHCPCCGHIVFTEFNIHWVTFLAGILVAGYGRARVSGSRADRAAAQLAGRRRTCTKSSLRK